MRYFGDFSSKEDVCREFSIPDFDGEVLVASYEFEYYEGSADVLFIRDGKFYYVSGSHCSCYGLEDQWSPEEVTVEQVEHMTEHGYGFWKRNPWIAEALRTLCK
jgi:hypothetical protein